MISHSRIQKFQALRAMPRDERFLFSTRIARLFAYGFLSVVLVLYLVEVGLSETQIGLLLTLTLIGDTILSLCITTTADWIGRRRMLIVGAGMMTFAGVLFAFTNDFTLLLIAATIGVISPSGNEVGPFLAIEQAALSQIVPDEQRTRVFAWYSLVGSFATASGALGGGVLAQALQNAGVVRLESYRMIVMGYATIGLLLILLFMRLSQAIEVKMKAGLGALLSSVEGPGDPGKAENGNSYAIQIANHPSGSVWISQNRLGLHHSRGVVLKLSALFALDAFAGGFVLQSIVAYWFQVRFGAEPAMLGSIFFSANILAGLSALIAARVASRIGLLNTMVFTHIPSNILLILVPLMPNMPLAILALLLRFSISQMDVPTRQSYTMAVVDPDERSAAAGVTGVARTTGAALSPIFTGPLIANPVNPVLLSMPFFLAGALKIVYDLMLYRSFRVIKPPEEDHIR